MLSQQGSDAATETGRPGRTTSTDEVRHRRQQRLVNFTNSPHEFPHNSPDYNVITPSDGHVASQIESEDPTDGMGHFVFTDEEDRAFFGKHLSVFSN